jgi:hypothetical protein
MSTYNTLDPEFYRQQADMYLRRADALANIPPEDPFKDGEILQFRKTFPNNKSFLYAAIRANDVWYVTGERGPSGISWHTLMEFVGTDNLHTIMLFVDSLPLKIYYERCKMLKDGDDGGKTS